MLKSHVCVLLVVVAVAATRAQGQERSLYTGPIIDMHMHASLYYLCSGPPIL